MSKIKELEDFMDNCAAIGEWVYYQDFLSFKPYIELAERIVAYEQEHDYIYSCMTDDMFENEQEKWYEMIKTHNDRKTRINELIQQIKEQK